MCDDAEVDYLAWPSGQWERPRGRRYVATGWRNIVGLDRGWCLLAGDVLVVPEDFCWEAARRPDQEVRVYGPCPLCEQHVPSAVCTNVEQVGELLHYFVPAEHPCTTRRRHGNR